MVQKYQEEYFFHYGKNYCCLVDSFVDTIHVSCLKMTLEVLERL